MCVSPRPSPVGCEYASRPPYPEQGIHDGIADGGSACAHGPALTIAATGMEAGTVVSAHARVTGTTANEMKGNVCDALACRPATMASTSRSPARWISSAVLRARERASSLSARSRLCTRYELRL